MNLAGDYANLELHPEVTGIYVLMTLKSSFIYRAIIQWLLEYANKSIKSIVSIPAWRMIRIKKEVLQGK